MKILLNSTHIAAIMRNVNDHDHLLCIDMEKNFYTPYGVFIPLYSSGYLLIRALRGDFEAKDLLKTWVSTRLLHINHLGQLWYITADSRKDDIAHQPIVGTDWMVTGFRNNEKGNSIAFGHLLKGCKTVEKAAARLDRIAYDGFFQPSFYEVAAVASRLKELGHTKPFIYTCFSDF